MDRPASRLRRDFPCEARPLTRATDEIVLALCVPFPTGPALSLARAFGNNMAKHPALLRRAWLASALALALLSACGPKGEQPLQGYVEGEYARIGAPFAGTPEQPSVER